MGLQNSEDERLFVAPIVPAVLFKSIEDARRLDDSLEEVAILSRVNLRQRPDARLGRS
jgi:hypothetical protein